MTMTDLKNRMERGLELRRKIFGESDESAWKKLNDDFDPAMNEYMLGFRWGTITARPGLDLRARQLCAIATFLALGNFEQVGDTIERHIRGALRCGATPQEVVEVIIQTGLWAGIYKWLIKETALKVFREMGYKQGVDWGVPLPTVTDLEDRMERGLELRRKIFGDLDESAWKKRNDDFDPAMNEYNLGLRWGTITARPGLDLRTRQLCAIATFLALGNFEQVGDTVERHIRGALRCGATPQEVVEVILQTGLWAGIYKWTIRRPALKIFREMGYKQGVDWGAPLPEDW